MQNTKIKKSKKGCVTAFLLTAAIVIILVIVVGLGGGLLYLRTIPNLEELSPTAIAETSKLYALDGSLISEFHAEENRVIIPFSKMSDNIRKAIVSIEDKRFYEHTGVDYKRIVGALLADIRTGSKAQGASTITMQYVRNVYFSPEKTFKRKINEAIIAIQVERHYTKDKILEMYLNTVPFGAGAYGIETASQTYFGISASELDIPQAALLAGLVNAPTLYNPFNNLEKAKTRRNIVLKQMYDQKKITKDEYMEALSSEVILNRNPQESGSNQENIAPYFIDYVKQQLYEKKFTDKDVFKGGLRIYTTLDPGLQKKAEDAILKVFPQDPGPSYGLVSVDSKNGYIYALVGGKDYNKNKFNVVTQGKRQPGSVFKVPVLIESIRQHISPNDEYNPNGPLTIDMPSGPDWVVENYGGEKFDTDKMTVIDATIHSVNVVYAQLMMKTGAKNVEDLLLEMGIEDIGSNPSIALGGLENGITPLDVSKIFSTLANNGTCIEPVCILKITDSSGNILYEYNPDDNRKEIIDAPSAYFTTTILERVITEGTGKGANIGRPAAGKTGTTSDYRDAWFGGYTPDLTTVVWMGHLESNIPMDPINKRTIVGGSFPADIWREYMSAALKDKPVSDFTSPEGELLNVQVCLDSGLLPTFWCPKESLGFMIFTKGKEPKDVCNIHNKVTVPDVIGKGIDEAKQILEGLNFKIDEEYQNNDEYDENTIFKTDPDSGEIVESLTGEPLNIILYISKGRESIELPDLSGVTLNKALKILESLGLEDVEAVYEFDDTQPADKIFSQDPSAGKNVDKDTDITLYVSKGSNPETVLPDVNGLTEANALQKLNDSGFTNVSVLTEESTKEIDKVFSQSPEPGISYPATQQIEITISLGVKVPYVEGMSKDDAVGLLEGLGFNVNIQPDPETDGTVKNQSPKKDSYLDFGSEVTITIEGGSDSSPGSGTS
jgi:penicillin-binding protein 1A